MLLSESKDDINHSGYIKSFQYFITQTIDLKNVSLRIADKNTPFDLLFSER